MRRKSEKKQEIFKIKDEKFWNFIFYCFIWFQLVFHLIFKALSKALTTLSFPIATIYGPSLGPWGGA